MGTWRLFDLRAERRDTKKKSSNRLRSRSPGLLGRAALALEPCEERLLFAATAPQLISIIPNQGSVITNGETVNYAPVQLTLNFQSGQAIDASTLANGVTVTQVSSADTPLAAPVTIMPGSLTVDSVNTNEVVVRFTEALGDGSYQVVVNSDLQNTSGVAFSGTSTTAFTVDFGAQVLAVVPQPVTSTTSMSGTNATLSQSPNVIDVYFNNDLLNTTSAQNVANYELINTNNSLVSANQVMYNPVSAAYSATNNEVVLTFASGVLTTAATWRLRVGDSDPLAPAPVLTEVNSPAGTSNVYTTTGSSFATSYNLGALSALGSGAVSEIVTGYSVTGSTTPVPLSISNATDPVQAFVTYPGSVYEPGHRLIPNTADDEVPVDGAGTAVPEFDYNFQSLLGYTAAGAPYYNTITAQQETDAEEILSLWGQYLGVDFVQTPDSGLTIATGDTEAVSPGVAPNTTLGIEGLDMALPTSTNGGPASAAPGNNAAIMSSYFAYGASEPDAAYYAGMFNLIGLALGIDYDETSPAITVMNTNDLPTIVANSNIPTYVLNNTAFDGNTVTPESIFPGDVDIVNGQYVMSPDVKDVNMFQFTVTQTGTVQLETLAQRLSTPSELQTVLRVFNSSGVQIAEDERYYGTDSNVVLTLTPGTYYVGVSSIGNDDYNPAIQDSGGGGTTQGYYELEVIFTPTQTSGLIDAGGVLFDGDDSDTPGGIYNFWFQTENWANSTTPENTVFVDKMVPATTSGATGSITNPYTNIATALADATPGEIVRIEGNSKDIAYEIGYATDSTDAPLSDGTTMDVPAGVTVMIDAGALLKFRSANINVGTVSQGVNHAGGALQILGTPSNQVVLTSYNNTAIGAPDGDKAHGALLVGGWGGIVFHGDADDEANGIFLDYVDEATITYGGGQVVVNSQLQVFDPIHIIDTQPTITNNTILDSADAAISADPNAFADLYFQTTTYTADYNRIGPNVYGNVLSEMINGMTQDNRLNGLLIRIATLAGASLDTLTVPAGLVDTDITYILTENLLISGNPGGSVTDASGTMLARLSGSLVIAPGVVVKLGGARIETTPGTSQLIAEGTSADPIIFTSLNDNSYGAGGTFMTNGQLSTTLPMPGDWGGILFGPVSSGSLDFVSILYAGGTTSIEGGYDNFNALEIDEARVRVADSTFEYNASGASTDDRNGRGINGPATIYIVGAQPILLNNTIENNQAAAISIDVNSLNSDIVDDWGRSTGFSYSPDGATLSRATFVGNIGPVISGNLLANNLINGLLVRGGVVDTEVVFDQTSIVYVVEDQITVPNVDTYGGLRIQSSSSASLVVKLLGATAGFTATGETGDIVNSIGGFVDIVGAPNYPVVLTSLNDNTVGAGLTPTGAEDLDTGNNPAAVPAAGDWDSVLIDANSNDNNFLVVNQELQSNGTPYSTPSTAQYLGQLAPNINSGDDTNRLGFEVHGALYNDSDVDVYSFNATAGTQVFIDLDRSSTSLGSVVELVDANGSVVAQAYVVLNPVTGTYSTVYTGLAQSMVLGPFDPGEEFSTNIRDAGMSVVLPGSGSTPTTYYVRVRSYSPTSATDPTVSTNLTGGLTDGAYQLQIRLSPTYQYPGSEVEYADIDYATNGVQVLGQPDQSPLIANTVSIGTNTTMATAQNLGNILDTPSAQVTVAASLTTTNWYEFQLNYDLTTGSTDWSGLFKVSYADGLSGPDTTLALYDSSGDLIMIGRGSDVTDNEPTPDEGPDSQNLLHGSFGSDPFIGTVELPTATTYYLEVLPADQLPSTLDQTFDATATNPLTRIEPIDSIDRVAEDQVNGDDEGDTAQNASATPAETLSLTSTPYNLGDVVMYVDVPSPTPTKGGTLYTVDPFTGTVETKVGTTPAGSGIQNIAMRNDGELYAFTTGLDELTNTDADDNYVQINTGETSAVATGQYITDTNDGITTYNATASGFTTANVGFNFTALGYVEAEGSTTRSLYGVGSTQAVGATPYDTNLIFQLDPDTGIPIKPDTAPVAGNAPTNYTNSGVILTAPTLALPAATPKDLTTAASENPATDIVDGEYVSINGTKFEFDSGPDLTLDPQGGTNTRDGQTFVVAGTTFVFKSGEVLTPGPGSEFLDGDSITITNSKGTPTTFTFNTTAGTNVILFNSAYTAAQMASDIVSTINAANVGVTASLNGLRINISGDTNIVLSITNGPAEIAVSGSFTVPAGDVAVPFQETDSQATLGGEIAAAVNGANIGVDASYGNGRISFYGAKLVASNFPLQSSVPTSPFISLNDNVDGQPANTGVAAGDIAVPFGAGDNASTLANELANAINGAGLAGITATATGGGLVQVVAAPPAIANISVSTPSPMTIAGAGLGGDVTGIAAIGNQLYAVSSGGSFYSVTPGANNSINVSTLISNEFDDNGNPIQFSGLTAGPPDVENGAYANLLFATDSSGNVYALNTSGQLQGIFTDGADSIATGISGAAGLAFSTLDYNLWHESDQFATDPGSGINPSPDDVGSRATTVPTEAYYFGLDSDVNAADQPDAKAYSTNPAINVANSSGSNTVTNSDGTSQSYDNFNLPGGAIGTLTTGTFSLAGYSADDEPTLYYDYDLNDDGISALKNFTDSFRVFISTDDGASWNELTTNNDILSTPTKPAELPQYISAEGGTYLGEAANQNMQETFANTGTWRQARVDLGDYAGDSDLELMFEYSSAGSMDVGDLSTNGDVISAQAGTQLTNSQSVTITAATTGAATTYQYNLGTVLDAMDGAAIANGDTFSLTGNVAGDTPAVFQFTTTGAVTAGNIAVAYTGEDSAATIATDIQTAIDNAGLDFTALVYNNRIELVPNTGTAPVTFTSITGNDLTAEAAPTGNVYVTFNSSASDVALALADAINYAIVPSAGPTPSILTAVKDEGTTIDVIENTIDSSNGISFSTSLPGDSFGNYFNTARNTENDYEGVAINDIIIGLAGRGEMVTDPEAGDTSVFTTPAAPAGSGPAPVYTGTYDLEISSGTNYAVSTATGLALEESFSVNDRLTQAFSLQAQPGYQITDGQSFVVTDGVHTVAFQFTTSGTTTNPNAVPVTFAVNDSAATVATQIATAINGAFFAGQLNVQAGTVNNGSQVNLFNAVQVNVASQVLAAPVGSAISNGETFTVSDGTHTQTFEFTTTGEVTNSTYLAVSYHAADPATTIAQEIAKAIDAATGASFLASASYSGSDVIVSNATQVSGFNYLVAPSGPDVTDGSVFQIGDGLTTIFFQMVSDDDSTAPPLPSWVPASATVVTVYYDPENDTDVDVANEMADAVNTSGLNVTATVSGSQVALSLAAGGTQLTVDSGALTTSIPLTLYQYNALDDFPLQGDTLDVATQGYTLIDANTISNSLDYGISVGPGARVTPDNPAAGDARNTITFNTLNLVPGISIENNVLVDNIQGGIQFAGDPGTSGSTPGLVPFGRIVNNTIYGGGTSATATPAGVGINVLNDASPTIINNILADLATGISVDASSTTDGTVVGYNLFQNNTSNGVTGSNSFLLQSSQPLFVDPTQGDFYLEEGTPAIDAGENSLQDRALMTAIEQPLGINPSPIIAPAFDRYGVLRVADPNSSNTPGTGQNPFIDIGAIQAADFNAPTASLITPAAGGATSVTVSAGSVPSTFQVELSDGNGLGINNAAINSLITAGTPPFSLTLNGNTLNTPNDYTYAFNTNTETITFTPASGVWAAGTYVITLNNSSTGGIEDLAGNLLKANNSSTGATSFSITIPASTGGGGGGGGGGGSTSGWQNPVNRYDVNNDGYVNPLDALILLQALNNDLFPDGVLPEPAPTNPPDYYDVLGTGILSPLDLLAEIQYLNAQAMADAQAQFAAASGSSSDSASASSAGEAASGGATLSMFAADSGASSSTGSAASIGSTSASSSTSLSASVSAASSTPSASSGSSSTSSFSSNAWVAAVAQYHATSAQGSSVAGSGGSAAGQGIASRTGLSAYLASSSPDEDDEDSFGSIAADVAAARAVTAS